MNLPPESITLYMIVDALDDLSFGTQECVFGMRPCSEEDSCALHSRWKDLKSREASFLHEVTLAEIVEAGETKAVAAQ